MTQLQFDFYIKFSMLQKIFEACIKWFYDVMIRSSAYNFYLSCFAIFMLVRFLVRPFVGEAIHTGVSDTVKGIKEKNRYHGKYEHKGKFEK